MALRPNLFVTVYTNTLYTPSAHYLHTDYRLSTHYLQNIYVQPTRTSGCSGPSSLGPHGRCSSHSSTTRPRPSPSQPSRRGRTAHSSRVSNTKFAFSKWESGLDNENCLNAKKYFYSDFPWFNCCGIGIVLQILYWILLRTASVGIIKL